MRFHLDDCAPSQAKGAGSTRLAEDSRKKPRGHAEPAAFALDSRVNSTHAKLPSLTSALMQNESITMAFRVYDVKKSGSEVRTKNAARPPRSSTHCTCIALHRESHCMHTLTHCSRVWRLKTKPGDGEALRALLQTALPKEILASLDALSSSSPILILGRLLYFLTFSRNCLLGNTYAPVTVMTKQTNAREQKSMGIGSRRAEL